MLGFLEILILTGLAVAIVFVVLVRRRYRATPADPQCGKCGYIVRGVPSLRCPECGADLREVGIVAAARGRESGGEPPDATR